MTTDLEEADALLVVGDSERNADLYYITRFRAPDPFVFLWTRQARILLMSDLELDRARAQAQVDQVLSLSSYEKRLRDQGTEQPARHQLLLALLQDLDLKRVRVPAEFPLELADQLRQAGLLLQAAPAPLFPQRQIKTPEEIAAIQQALRAAEQGMEVAVSAIRSALVKDQVLYADGQVLTAERLRRLIHHRLLEEDCLARHTIVACGEQGCDPHQEGSGPLRAGQTIVIDLFPQSAASGYFGDLTRTVFKGRAPRAVRKLYEAVQRGQELALAQVRAGADGRQIHQAVQDLFAAAGYQTGEKDGRRQGFFHGTGHGLGLEIHEAPRIGPRGEVLRSGQVVTVEPGLYYPEVGAIRIEDVVVVREDGCQNLTTYPKFLEV